jgi:hypothetical protein
MFRGENSEEESFEFQIWFSEKILERTEETLIFASQIRRYTSLPIVSSMSWKEQPAHHERKL